MSQAKKVAEEESRLIALIQTEMEKSRTPLEIKRLLLSQGFTEDAILSAIQLALQQSRPQAKAVAFEPVLVIRDDGKIKLQKEFADAVHHKVFKGVERADDVRSAELPELPAPPKERTPWFAWLHFDVEDRARLIRWSSRAALVALLAHQAWLMISAGLGAFR